MAVMAPERNQTGERLDDLANRTEDGFREQRAATSALRAEMGEVRAEIGQVREGLGEVRAELKGFEKKFDAKFDALNRTMQIGFGLIGAMLAGILGLVAALL
jgi:septal ring factor EnvC (AmiA/AmiB activator)